MKTKYIIIHSIAKELDVEGEKMGAIEFLESIGLSAHYFIDSKGESFKMVNWKEKAKHAGISKWKEDSNLNNCSIGIELMIDNVSNYAEWKKAINDKESFTNEHYTTCAEITASLCFENGLHPKDCILLHSEVSGDEVRGKGKGKVDPGQGFDKQRLVNMVEAELLHYPPLI